MHQDTLVTHRKYGADEEQGIQLSPTISRPPSTADSKILHTACHCSSPPPLDTIYVQQNDTMMDSLKISLNSQRRKQKMAERLHLCACFWFAFIIGWNDGSTGPLLPRIREVYHVNDLVSSFFLMGRWLICFLKRLQVGFILVSMIFVCTTIVSHLLVWGWSYFIYKKGFIFGALMNFFLTTRLGFGKVKARHPKFYLYLYSLHLQTIMLGERYRKNPRTGLTSHLFSKGSLCQIITYSIQAPGPPFPAFAIAYAINGFGLALEVILPVLFIVARFWWTGITISSRKQPRL